jgi:peroxiredoxin
MKRIALAAALLVAASLSASTSPIGEKAPDFSAVDLTGKRVTLSDYRGNIVVIHFAATWCPFCNAEAPHLQALAEEYRDRGVKVLVIDVKEPEETVARWAKRSGFSFPVLLDTEGKIAASYALPDILPDLPRDETVLASNLLIDRDGRIAFYSLLDTRAFDAKLVALRERLDQLLERNV